MPKSQIVINVCGGLVQEVFCSIPDAEVILVDFDLESPSNDESGVCEIESDGRSARVFVDQFEPQPIHALAGTDVEQAIDEAALAEA